MAATAATREVWEILYETLSDERDLNSKARKLLFEALIALEALDAHPPLTIRIRKELRK